MSKRVTRSSTRTKRPKAKLGLPDLDHSKAAVLDSLRSPESKRGIDEFIQWCCEPRLPMPEWVKETVDSWTGAAEPIGGKLFRCVCRAGNAMGDGVTKRVVCHAPGSAIPPAESWSRFNSSSGTFPCRPLNGIAAANSGFVERLAITSAASRNATFRLLGAPATTRPSEVSPVCRRYGADCDPRSSNLVFSAVWSLH